MTSTYRLHESDPYYEQALAEHRELHETFERLRTSICSIARPTELQFQKTVADLTDLRDKLARHFAQEEQGGYLEEAIAHLPAIAPQAEALQRQHADFLRTTNGLLEEARGQGSTVPAWENLRNGFLRLFNRLESHEAAENVLLDRAFNEDLGSGL